MFLIAFILTILISFFNWYGEIGINKTVNWQWDISNWNFHIRGWSWLIFIVGYGIIALFKA